MSVEPPRNGPGATGPGQKLEGRAAPYQPNEPTGYVSEGRSGQLVPTGGDEATGELVLVLTPQPGSKFRGMVTPVVTINGWPVPAHWDANVLTAPAGRHRIQVGMRYLWTQAPIEFDADVTVGQQTVVHYTGPWSLLVKGSLGYTPQRPHGRWIWIVPLAVALALPVLIGLTFLVIGAIAGA